MKVKCLTEEIQRKKIRGVVMEFYNNFNLEDLNLAILAMDHIDVGIYIADIDSHELLYVNKKFRDALNKTGAPPYDLNNKKGMCYEILQNKSAPCSFCNNHCLNENEVYSWQFYNVHMDKHFDLKDTLVLYKNRRLRVETAIDIGSHIQKQNRLEEKITFEQTLVTCANTLTVEEDTTLAINNILETLGAYYLASKCYIFEFDDTKENIVNTYQWIKNRNSSSVSLYQSISVSKIQGWFDSFEKKGYVIVDNEEQKLEESSFEFQLLKRKGAKNIYGVPLRKRGKLYGLFTVDDISAHKNDIDLLKTVSTFILDHLSKMKIRKNLESLSNVDRLTGHYNRNYYESNIIAIEGGENTSIGVIYVDINGLKRINDKFGHSYGDLYIVKCAQILKTQFSENVYRIGGDEFVVILTKLSQDEFYMKITQLNEKLHKEQQISMSVGVAFCQYSNQIHSMIKMADMNMFNAKEEYYKTGYDESGVFERMLIEVLEKESRHIIP